MFFSYHILFQLYRGVLPIALQLITRTCVASLFLFCSGLAASVVVGADVLFGSMDLTFLHGKRIGLITNHAAIDQNRSTTVHRILSNPKLRLEAIFSPEHGFYGEGYAYECIADSFHRDIPIRSLHGQNRRPSPEQLRSIDVLIFDMQDIGSRSYTYTGTLFYCMEEAAKLKIPFLVLDRPNPQGGITVDGPLLDEEHRSFLGYINIPYCHGMTLGELASFFNNEYSVGCRLTVIPMKGWKRNMSFADTGLPWVPTSPQIPEPDTALYYPTTGLLGGCVQVNIGIGYTLPFKVVGAPWIDADQFADACNAQKLPGIHFKAFHFRPFFGRYKNENCHGVLLSVTQPNDYLPVTTAYTLIGVLKNLYPQQFHEGIKKIAESKSKTESFLKLHGRSEVLRILEMEPFFIWKLRSLCQADRSAFLQLRKKYLLPDYSL